MGIFSGDVEMKIVRMILVAGLLMGLLASATQAEGKKKGKVLRITGKVASVSENSITVTPAAKNADEITTAIGEKTKIKVNGKPGTAADIQVGMKVAMQYTQDGAIAIVAKDDDKKRGR